MTGRKYFNSLIEQLKSHYNNPHLTNNQLVWLIARDTQAIKRPKMKAKQYISLYGYEVLHARMADYDEAPLITSAQERL